MFTYTGANTLAELPLPVTKTFTGLQLITCIYYFISFHCLCYLKKKCFDMCMLCVNLSYMIYTRFDLYVIQQEGILF